MKIGLSLGVLGPSGRDLAQGEFSFFSFAMVVCAQEVAPTSKMDEAGVRWRGRVGGPWGSGVAEGGEHEKVAIFGHG